MLAEIYAVALVRDSGGFPDPGARSSPAPDGRANQPGRAALTDVEPQLTGSVDEVGVENSCNVRQSSWRGHTNMGGIDGIVVD